MIGDRALVPSQVLLAFDDQVFRHGLETTLAFEPDLEVVASHTPPETVDLAVVELAATRQQLDTVLRNGRPRCKVLVVSAFEEPTLLAALFHAGVPGYALKTQPPAQIVDAVRVILEGRQYTAPGLDVLPPPYDDVPSLRRLTEREREVYELLILGAGNDEIGARLNMARRTVETHRQHILKKLAAHSIHELIRVSAWQWTL